MRSTSAIHKRPRTSVCLLASTTRAKARSTRGSLNRPDSRMTMMPAYWLGGYRSGSEKPLSSVTRQRPSVAHIRARLASGVESRFWSATVAHRTPRPSETRRPLNRLPVLDGQRGVGLRVDLDGVPHLTGRLWTRLRKNKESATLKYDPEWLRHRARFALEPALTLGPVLFRHRTRRAALWRDR